jgi:DNA repair exonuclease SbcCD ATPase subunit
LNIKIISNHFIPKNAEAFGTSNKKLKLMQKIITLSLAVATSFCFGQSISVKETNEKFSTGAQNAVGTTILENNADDVINEWKKVLKDYKYEKVKDKDNEVFGDNILIKDWGNNPVDFYTKFEEDKKAKTVKMSVAVDLGGTYLTSAGDKEKYRFVEKMVKDFAVKMTKVPMEGAVKIAEKSLGKLEDDQRDLEKDKKNLQEDIVNYKNKIAKAEKDIVVKDGEIEKKKGEVNVQKKVVDASSDAVSEQAKSSKKIYEKLQDQLQDLEKDRKNLKDDVSDNNEKIKKAENDIKKNEENQVKKKEEIEKQKKVVADAKKKLEGVN